MASPSERLHPAAEDVALHSTEARALSGGLACVAFLSGAAALLFETLWFRAAGIAFGRGVWASSLVLAAFMAGLALGNAVAARHADRRRRPVLLYAGLEMAIGIGAASTVLGLPAVDASVAAWIGSLRDVPALANGLRLALAFAAMVVPAAAMGATLPVLVRGLQPAGVRYGVSLGRLYGWNTLGAVVGALLGEIWWIAWLGIPGAALAGAGLNGAAALGAVALSRRFEARGAAPPATPAPRRPGVEAAGWRRLGAAFLAGGLFLALETVWFRLLSLFVIGTSGVFAAMLAVVLAGIGLGGLVAGRWLARTGASGPWLPTLALAAGAAALASYGLYAPIQSFLWPSGQPAHHVLEVAVLAVPLVGPVAFLSGVLFTVLGDDARRALGADGRTTGWLTFANTLGAAVGALVGGFGLLPGLGVERSIIGLGLGYVLLLPLLPRPARAGPAFAAVALAAALLAALLFFPHGHLRARHLARPLAIYGEPGSEIVAVREGRLETLVLLRTSRFGAPLHHRLMSNGYSQSATHYSARRYMRGFVHLAVALRPEPESALVLSYGIGTTARALVETPSLRRIAVVDISRDVLEFNDAFLYAPGESPLQDERVEVFVEDSRFHLQTRPERYDLITGEPPPPKLAGVVNLFTREYFEAIHRRLTDGGIASYWLPVHDLTGSDALAILRGFCDVFPDCTLWAASGLDWVMIGRRGESAPVADAALAAQWRSPRLAAELRSIGFETPASLLATWIAGPERLARDTRDVPPLVDAHPRRLSEHVVPQGYARRDPVIAAWLQPDAARRDFETSAWVSRHLPQRAAREARAGFPWEDLVRRQIVPGSGEPLTDRDLHRVLLESPLHTLPLWMLGSSQAAQRLAARRPPASRTPAVSVELGIGALAERQYPRAAAAFAKAHGDRRPAPRARALEALSLCLDGQKARSVAAARALLRRVPESRSNASYWDAMSRTCGWPGFDLVAGGDGAPDSD